MVVRHHKAVADKLLLLLLLDWQHGSRVDSPLEVVGGGDRRVVLAMSSRHLRKLDLIENRPHIWVLVEDSLELLGLRLVFLQRTQSPFYHRILLSLWDISRTSKGTKVVEGVVSTWVRRLPLS